MVPGKSQANGSSPLEFARSASVLLELCVASLLVSDDPESLLTSTPLDDALPELGPEPVDASPVSALSLPPLGMRSTWGPQDSFSHSIRSDNLQRIWHVLNFDDALTRDYVEERDGLRHSGAMDRCDGTTDPIYDTAIEASADVVAACLADGTSLQHPGNGVVTTLLERWMAYEPGCNHGSGYCDSPWLELARTEPTAPVLGGCSVTPKRDGMLGLACVLIVLLRRRRKSSALTAAGSRASRHCPRR